MTKKKRYIPPPRFNPAVIAQKVDELNDKYEKLRVASDHKYQALQNFLTLLVNFASHDIKNAVHNLDGIVSTVTPATIVASDFDNMKVSLDHIRATLERFMDFNLKSNQDSFEMLQLFNSLEILHRPSLKYDNIKFKITYDGIPKTTLMHHDFLFLLYMLNNLMINSNWALKTNEIDDRRIELIISWYLMDKSIKILFCDNGCGIPVENREKIFTAYFTTREKGTGVGLTHVQYVINSFPEGKISLTTDKIDGLITIFEIILPIASHEASDSNN